MADEPKVTIGPVQMLVVGFAEPHFTGKIMAELKRLRELDMIRLVDMIVVQKDAEENVVAVQVSDLSPEEATQFGAIAGALIGFGMEPDEEGIEAGAIAGAEAMADGHLIDEGEVWYVADAIPVGSTAAVALLEHRWAIPLRDAIMEAGGTVVADEWIHAKDLIAVGLLAGAAE
jgi:uncharacterized membrane protein